MALSITLEGEFGDKLETVLDSENLLHRLLPRQENAEYALLHYIDWYGNTIFNRMQMKSLISDLQKLSGRTTIPNPAKQYIDAVQPLP